MLYRTTLAALVLALPGASAQLHKLAKAAGLQYFGSATDNGELSDVDYVNILKNTDEFGQIVSLAVLRCDFRRGEEDIPPPPSELFFYIKK